MTKEARWLLLACDMGLSFTELCVLGYMIMQCKNNTTTRKTIHDIFVGVVPLQRIVDILTHLKKIKYVHSSSKDITITGKTKTWRISYKSEFETLYHYIKNTLISSKKSSDISVKNTPRKSFDGVTYNSYIRKDSKVYTMLKHGPLPDNYSYLVKDGKITKEARWLLLACDMGLSFAELCVLGYMILLYRESTQNTRALSWMCRPWVYDSFAYFLDFWTVQNIFAKFKKMGLIKTYRPGRRAVVFQKNIIEKIIKSHRQEIDELEVYVRTQLDLPPKKSS